MGWEYFAYLAVALIVGYALQPKPPSPAPPAAFEDFDFPQIAEGTPQCVIFGDVWIDDWMVLGVGNYSSEAIWR